MPWRKRLLAMWRHASRWLDRWVRPPALVLAVLFTAAATALVIVRLMMLAIGHVPALADDWQSNQPALPPPPTPSVETPQEAAEHQRGLWVLGLGAGALLVLVVAALVAQTLARDQRPADYFKPVGARPMPALNLLTGYHWVDQKAGVVQIPIDRAMDLLAQRGLPARSAADSQSFIDHGQGGPSDSSGGRSP